MKINILLFLIILLINLGFTSSSQLSPQFLTIPAYRANNDPSQSSYLFCPEYFPSYPLKSIVISNVGSIDRATLTVPDQPRSVIDTAKSRGMLLVFDNPPISQCYLLNFASQTSDVNPTDMNNIKVQFVYDSSNTEGMVSSEVNNGSEDLSRSPRPNMYTVCGSIICRNGGVCQYLSGNRYQCQCGSSSQWLGIDCSKPNPCISTPCNNGGQCYYLSDATYYCVCYSGYSGNNCQFSAMTPTTVSSYNPCLSARPCLNGGTCLSKGNQGEFTCVCSQGYTGTNCQSLSYLPSTATVPSNTCGVSISKSSVDFDRIINGQPVYTYVWPWIVSLQTMSGGSHFCGGTLVDAFHVITAAHCLDPLRTSPNTIKVVAGLLNLQQIYVSGVQQLAVDSIFRHERYTSTGLVNDIAVIKLRTAARFTSVVYPICLPANNGAQDPKVGQNVQIAGWGYTNSATKILAQQLQQATIQTLDINGDLYGGPGCNSWLRQGYSVNNAQQICAMSRDTRTDSCQGDSGGPLIRNIGSSWFLFGIVSYGDAVCASSTAAGVYTRVSAYIPWIQQKLQL